MNVKDLPILKERTIRCVYFLMQSDEVVYVGITNDLDERVKAHRLSKQFDWVRFLDASGMSDKEMQSLEKSLIHSVKPKLNSVHTERQPQKAIATRNRTIARLNEQAPKDCETMQMPISHNVKLGLCEAGMTTAHSIINATDEQLYSVRYLARKQKSIAKIRATALAFVSNNLASSSMGIE